MAELLTKKVLFQGTGEIDQVDKIFKVLGSPTEERWPGYKELSGVKKVKLLPEKVMWHPDLQLLGSTLFKLEKAL